MNVLNPSTGSEVHSFGETCFFFIIGVVTKYLKTLELLHRITVNLSSEYQNIYRIWYIFHVGQTYNLYSCDADIHNVIS